MNTKAKGDIGEQLAAEYLKSKGYTIVERNAKYCDCEVDIICEAYVDEYGDPLSLSATDKLRKLLKKPLQRKGEYVVVFVEVKTRYNDTFGSGLEAVDGYKAGRYVTAARACAQRHGLLNQNFRFDIIEVDDGKINHVVNAFDMRDAKYSKKYR